MTITILRYDIVVSMSPLLLLGCGLAAAHLALAIIVTVKLAARPQGRRVPHLLLAWLVPVIGPASVLWQLRPAPEPPVLPRHPTR